MIYANRKPLVAISYDTETFKDLTYFIKTEHNLTVNRIDPEEFANRLDKDVQYINLVILDFQLREKISQLLDEHKLDRFSYVHSTNFLSDAKIGRGVFMWPHSMIYPRVVIGNDVLVQSNAVMAHNSMIGQGSFIAVGVKISGSTSIGKFCYLGIDSTVIDKLSICDRVTVGAKSLVIDSIDSAGVYAGNPVKLLK